MDINENTETTIEPETETVAPVAPPKVTFDFGGVTDPDEQIRLMKAALVEAAEARAAEIEKERHEQALAICEIATEAIADFLTDAPEFLLKPVKFPTADGGESWRFEPHTGKISTRPQVNAPGNGAKKANKSIGLSAIGTWQRRVQESFTADPTLTNQELAALHPMGTGNENPSACRLALLKAGFTPNSTRR